MIIGAALIFVGTFLGLGGMDYVQDFFAVNEKAVVLKNILDKDLIYQLSKANFENYDDWVDAKKSVIFEIELLKYVLNLNINIEAKFTEEVFNLEKIYFETNIYPEICDQYYSLIGNNNVAWSYSLDDVFLRDKYWIGDIVFKDTDSDLNKINIVYI